MFLYYIQVIINIYFVEYNAPSLSTSKRSLTMHLENNMFTPNWSCQFFIVIIELYVASNSVHLKKFRTPIQLSLDLPEQWIQE